MDLNDVRLFARVIEAGDFSAAARRAALSPSTISKAIARLERHLGVRLFHRSPRSVQLTAEGENFAEASRRLLAAADEAEAVCMAIPRGTLRIKSLPSFAIHCLAPLMPAFSTRYPRVDVEFTLTTDRTFSLDDGTDIALVSGSPPNSAKFIRKITSSRWIVCASEAYLQRRGRPSSPADLADHVCLNFSMSTGWNAWSQAIPDVTPAPQTITANHGDMLLALARAGTGLVRLAEYHVREDLQAGRLVALFPEFEAETEDAIHAVFHDRRLTSPRVRAFLDFMAEALER